MRPQFIVCLLWLKTNSRSNKRLMIFQKDRISLVVVKFQSVIDKSFVYSFDVR